MSKTTIADDELSGVEINKHSGLALLFGLALWSAISLLSGCGGVAPVDAPSESFAAGSSQGGSTGSAGAAGTATAGTGDSPETGGTGGNSGSNTDAESQTVDAGIDVEPKLDADADTDDAADSGAEHDARIDTDDATPIDSGRNDTETEAAPCVCSSGQCCDGCNFRPWSHVCGEAVYETRCRVTTTCRALEEGYRAIACNGDAAECTRWGYTTFKWASHGCGTC